MSRLDAAQSMRLPTLFRICLRSTPALLAVVAPPCAAAFILETPSLGMSLLPQVLVLTALTVWAARHPAPADLREMEATGAFAFLFLAACAIAVPPFLVLGMDPLPALFEAVSGITSTGLSVARETEGWPIAAHLLRGWLQWCGGFALAVAAVAILPRSSGSLRALASVTIDERDRLTTIREQARQLLQVYGVLTAVAVAGSLMLFPTWWEGVSIALAAVSTGGFTPRADSMASYGAAAQVFTISICVVAALSFLALVTVWRGQPGPAILRSHSVLFLALMAGGAGGSALVAHFWAEAGIGVTVFNFVSGLTTAGFFAGPISAMPVLMFLLIAAMVVGGETGSTGGGIKVGRLATLLEIIRLSFQRLRMPPHSVTHLRDGGERQTADAIIAVSAIVTLYVLTVALAWTVFLTSGAPPIASLLDVVSAASTVGLSSGVTGPDMEPHLMAVLTVVMLLGRLEFLALIALLLPGTWSGGS